MYDLEDFPEQHADEVRPLPNFKVGAIYPFFVCETGITVPYVDGIIKKDEDAVSITLWGWLEYPETLKEYGYIVLSTYHPLSGRIYYQEVAPLTFAQWDTLRVLFYASLQQPNAHILNELQEQFVRAVREAFFAHPTTLLEDWAKNLRAMQKVWRGKQPADPEERLLLKLRGWATPKRSRKK
jgi:hypothetical protein